MTIAFADKKLKKMTDDYALCCRKMGDVRARLLFARLGAFEDARTLENVLNLPGRFHALSGNRQGQWACDLDHPYRLIFRPISDSIPVYPNDRYILSEITAVEILEITDYH